MDVDFFYEKVKSFFHRENLLTKVELSKERSTRRIVIYVLPDHHQKSSSHHHNHPSTQHHGGGQSHGHHHEANYSSSSSTTQFNAVSSPDNFGRHHGGGAAGTSAEKYFQCTECQFNCKGASDFANHLVIHSVEHREHQHHKGAGGAVAKTPFGDLPPMRSDHPDLRRGCPFHEGG